MDEEQIKQFRSLLKEAELMLYKHGCLWFKGSKGLSAYSNGAGVAIELLELVMDGIPVTLHGGPYVVHTPLFDEFRKP